MLFKTFIPAVALALQSFQPTLCAPGEDFSNIYKKEEKPLYSTRNSSIFVCTHKNTQNQKILKEFFLKSSHENSDHELQIMHYLQQKPHPNLIHLEDEFITGTLRQLIFKRYKKDLFDQIAIAPLTIKQQKKIFFNIASAVAHLHRNEIAHRDISLENILLDDDFKGYLCDFGAACYKEDMTSSFCGKKDYAAPEVFIFLRNRTPYNPYIADIWSLGITFYVAVSHEFLFDEASDCFIGFRKIKDLGSIKNFLPKRILKNIDSGLLDLLTQMLQINPQERISIEDVLIHPWFHSDVEEK